VRGKKTGVAVGHAEDKGGECEEEIYWLAINLRSGGFEEVL
jgi:hypothetical protein